MQLNRLDNKIRQNYFNTVQASYSYMENVPQIKKQNNYNSRKKTKLTPSGNHRKMIA